MSTQGRPPQRTTLTARLGPRVEPGTYVVTITTAAGASASTKLTLKR